MSQGNLGTFFDGKPFDPATVPPADNFEALPAGEYPAQIEEADLVPTRKGDGHRIGLKLKLLVGPAKGRVLFDNLNIDNPNETAVRIAKQSLSALCKATIGNARLTDTNQFVGKVCVAHVTVKNGENNIRTYSQYADAASVQQPVQQQQQQQQPVYVGPNPTLQPPQQDPSAYHPQQMPPVQQQQQQQLPDGTPAGYQHRTDRQPQAPPWGGQQQ